MKMTGERRAVDKIFRRQNRYEVPDWQRGEVWDRPKKQRLIDSIHLEPKYVVFRFSSRPAIERLAKASGGRLRVADDSSAYLPLTKDLANADVIRAEIKSLLRRD